MAFAPLSSDETPNQAFLSNNDDDNFADLDSMTVPRSFTSQYDQYRPQQPQPPQQSGALVPHSLYNNQSNDMSNTGGGGDAGADIGRVSDGVNGGFTGVSESLFDRIRARAEQQSKQPSVSQQSSFSSSSQQQQHHHHQQQSAFVSQHQASEPTMELEKDQSFGTSNSNNNAFAAPAPSAHTSNSNTTTANEKTYSFSGPSDFSSHAPPHIPTYGPSRNDPNYSAPNNYNNNNNPSSIQDKAAMAWENTSSTVKSLWDKASVGAQTIGDMVRDARGNMGAGGSGRAGGGGGYNNNFLLREGHDEDDMERGGDRTATMNAPHPTTASSSAPPGGADQAYSMMSYAKTFFEDIFGFVKDLPSWGKVFLVIILLWAFFAFKG